MSTLTAEPFAFQFARPMAKVDLSLNSRMHHMTKAKHVREWRAWAAEETKRVPYLGRISVVMTWFVKDARRRDEDNLVLILKAICDGLVDSGVVYDDTHEEMQKFMPRIITDRRMTENVLNVEIVQLNATQKGIESWQ